MELLGVYRAYAAHDAAEIARCDLADRRLATQ
jgi:hypothetical protein